MTRQWDTQAREWDSEVQRRTIEKLRRDNAVMRNALDAILVRVACGFHATWCGTLAAIAINKCDADADAVLDGEPRVDAESVPTPDMPVRTPFVIGVEALDAIKAGVEPETSGRTEATP